MLKIKDKWEAEMIANLVWWEKQVVEGMSVDAV